MTALGKRLATSAVFVTITIATIFFAPAWLFFLIVQIFALLGLYEFLNLAEKSGIVINRYLGIFFGFLLPFFVYFSAESLLLVTACLAIFIYNFGRPLREKPLVGTSVTIFGILYVVWFFAHLLKIRALPDGAVWVFYAILIVKAGDAGAYFVGKRFGRMKLIEHISPNKSVEGAWGGLATSIVLSVISKIYLRDVPLLHLFFLGTGVSILAQFGDLAESLIKREVGVKDSGAVPGLGGILDVLDSLLLTLPFVYYYIISFHLS